MVVGGYDGTNVLNDIQYVTISQTGNTVDFGDLATVSYTGATCSSSTRGVHATGVNDPARINTIEYFTISTLGNSADFGDLVTATNASGGLSN